MRLPNVHPWVVLAGGVLLTAHRSPLTAQMPDVERERREYARWLASAPTSPLGAVALAPVGRGIEIGGRRSDVPLEGLPLHRVTEDRGRLTLSGPHGNRSLVRGRPVTIGKPGLFTQDGALPEAVMDAVVRLQGEGRTVMVVRWGDRFLGVLGVMDTPRESARAVVAELHALGIEQTLMLTGDNQRVADAVAKHVGIRVALGDLLPEEKVAAITELARSKSRVAMVGDGVNDAPAMANATVGIAMGAGGSDVALETADVALMADDLHALPFAVGLSRAARDIIRQNLWVSLGMVAFLVPATIFGFAKIGVAVALHEGSTLLVVANALRLLRYGGPQGQS